MDGVLFLREFCCCGVYFSLPRYKLNFKRTPAKFIHSTLKNKFIKQNLSVHRIIPPWMEITHTDSHVFIKLLHSKLLILVVKTSWARVVQQYTVTNNYAFSVSAPSIWNSKPLLLRLSPSLASFKQNLKTLYFVISEVAYEFSRSSDSALEINLFMD